MPSNNFNILKLITGMQIWIHSNGYNRDKKFKIIDEINLLFFPTIITFCSNRSILNKIKIFSSLILDNKIV